ncbi:hypothetical protein SVAN01_05517 [Stagonosporopsis vannaccii]|nr:hypothetical protein SVAN01_05517 [Stagonosporopsis vannaccii]
MSEEFDLLIVGAGMHGIAMAKTYTEIHPEARILLVDSAHTIGGSWAFERLYPRLKTNNVLGSYEFSGFPMVPRGSSAVPGGHIPGQVVHEYLNDVAACYGFDKRCRLGTLVESAIERHDGTWSVELRKVNSEKAETYSVATKKLVIAAGLTSEPNMPTFVGQESFSGHVLHSKQLKEKADDLARCKTVVVVGGNKSAWDACYDAARHGSQVTMVIRPSGGGPSYVWPRKFKWGPWWTSLARLSSTRFFTAFDPTFHSTRGPMSWWARFLHNTWAGAVLRNYFWTTLDRTIRRLNRYTSHPELAKLEPWTTPFWMGNSLSIHNYETDWFQLVRDGRIKIRIAEIDRLASSGLTLDSGEALDAEALVCCTGWKSRSVIQFHDTSGSPVVTPDVVLRDIERAQGQISNQLGYLETLPKRTSNAPTLSTDTRQPTFTASNHLYRFMVPWQPAHLLSKNVAYIGTHCSIHAVLVAQVQALWITAFFDNKISSLTHSCIDFEAVRYEAILQGVYGASRRPKECGGAAGKHADLVFDSLPYIDSLLDDLGLIVNRKSGVWKTLFASHSPRDYETLIGDYKAKHVDKIKST